MRAAEEQEVLAHTESGGEPASPGHGCPASHRLFLPTKNSVREALTPVLVGYTGCETGRQATGSGSVWFKQNS